MKKNSPPPSPPGRSAGLPERRAAVVLLAMVSAVLLPACQTSPAPRASLHAASDDASDPAALAEVPADTRILSAAPATPAGPVAPAASPEENRPSPSPPAPPPAAEETTTPRDPQTDADYRALMTPAEIAAAEARARAAGLLDFSITEVLTEAEKLTLRERARRAAPAEGVDAPPAPVPEPASS